MSTVLQTAKAHVPAITRREFGFAIASSLVPFSLEAAEPPKVLIVVAHPDDEYAFAATTYRIARELGGLVDQVVISNGEAGYRYSALAEAFYGVALTREDVGRDQLPEIRRQETLAAGRILGIRHHHFLGQKDSGYTLDPAEVDRVWDREKICSTLERLVKSESYDFVFTLLPTPDTHGHHQAATVLALESVSRLPVSSRPTVLGAEAASSSEPARIFVERDGYKLTRTAAETYEFSRSTKLGFKNALSYSIIVNWVIAEHKSQGLFQTDAGKRNVERFWRFETGGEDAAELTRNLFHKLSTEEFAKR